MICPILTAIEIIDGATAIFAESHEGKKLLQKSVRQCIRKAHERDSMREVASVITYAITGAQHSDCNRLHELGPRIAMLREGTDCPRELVEAIDDMLVGMLRTRSLMKWKMTETVKGAIHDPEVIERIKEMVESS